jgi:hypothetical protein
MNVTLNATAIQSQVRDGANPALTGGAGDRGDCRGDAGGGLVF